MQIAADVSGHVLQSVVVPTIHPQQHCHLCVVACGICTCINSYASVKFGVPCASGAML